MTGIVKKILTQQGHLWKVILWTTCGLLVLEIEEKGFVGAADFPKQNSYVHFENVTFTSCTKV